MSIIKDIRRNTIRAYALGMITGSFLTASVVVFAAPAKADPANEVATLVCSSLDAQPTVDNVVAIVNDLVRFGATPQQAGQIVAISVMEYCTRNIPVVEAFVEQYADHSAGHKQAMGGKVA